MRTASPSLIIETYHRFADACYDNDTSEIIRLLDQGLSVNHAFRFGETPLIVACKSGHENIVRLLLERGASTAQIGKGDSPLHIACKTGKLSIMRRLIAAGANVNSLDKFGIPPIMDHCTRRDRRALSLLIESGADVNVTCKEGLTVLFAAVRSGNIAFISDLLAAGADPNKSNGIEGKVALHEACVHRSGNVPIAKLLLKHGANIDQYDGAGYTALCVACQSLIFKTVKLLLDEGADVNKPILRNGNTPLMSACKMLSPDIVRILLTKGAAVNLRDNEGRHALAFACLFSDGSGKEDILGPDSPYNIIVALEYYGPIYHIPYWQGRNSPTSRHSQRADVVSLLLASKTDVNATFGRHNQTALLEACTSCDIGIISMLIESGADIQHRNLFSNTALHFAAKGGNPEVVLLLIRKGADVNARGALGVSPLLMACAYNNAEAVDVLLANGADAQLETLNGLTTLMAACYRSNLNVIQKLLDSGVDVNRVDSHGAPAIYYACTKQHLEAIALLLERGADITIGMEAGLDSFEQLSPELKTSVTVLLKSAPCACPFK